jgi:hypothetical protein
MEQMLWTLLPMVIGAVVWVAYVHPETYRNIVGPALKGIVAIIGVGFMAWAFAIMAATGVIMALPGGQLEAYKAVSALQVSPFILIGWPVVYACSMILDYFPQMGLTSAGARNK